MISQMMELADYPESSQGFHRSFFADQLSYFLGRYPKVTEEEKSWRSFMADDHTPLEMSWSWSTGDSTPVVRYAAEPIGWFAGTALDPMNTRAGSDCLDQSLPWAPSMDLEWYNHFSHALLTASETATATTPANEDSPSQAFIGFDLEANSMTVKYYFIPSCKAGLMGMTPLSLAVESISSLQQQDQDLETPLSVVSDYISTFPAETKPQVLIVAVDCLEPRRSRVKIYIRYQHTSFESMIEAMSLGGALPPYSQHILSELREFWCSCFGVDDTSQALPNVKHRTAGLLYYYELRGNQELPTSKVYLPVRHYASNDDQIARGVSSFLLKRGMTLKGGLSYYDGLSHLW